MKTGTMHSHIYLATQGNSASYPWRERRWVSAVLCSSGVNRGSVVGLTMRHRLCSRPISNPSRPTGSRG